MRKSFVFILLIFCLSLAACKPILNNPTATPSSDQVATQVSAFLTSMPSPTLLPQPQSTHTLIPTLAPTQSSSATQIASTPTVQVTSTLNPTSTSTTAFTATPTSTLAITATFSPGDPRLKLGNPAWQDTFKTDLNWPTGSDTYTSIQIQDNTLNLTALTKKDGWRLSYSSVQNFYLEGTLKSDNCSASDHFGLIIRVPDKKTANQGYLFGITCDGQYSLRKWDGIKMTDLIKWTASSVINSGPGKMNRLGIMAVGDHFGVYVNGALLAESIDSSYSEGAFGIFVGGQTPNLTVTMTAIAYWENP